MSRESTVEDVLRNFVELYERRGADWAEESLRAFHPEAIANRVMDEFYKRVGEITFGGPGLTDPDSAKWYHPMDGPRWSYTKKRLGLPEDVVASTSRVADEIVAKLADPASEDITTRGLVLGYVQSGKTTNYLSVAAKAADAGYSLIIVLAGVHNSLRRQTQDRAYDALIHKAAYWWSGTKLGDFRSDGNPPSSHLSGNSKRGLLVVKKHKTILSRLANWLESESDSFLRRHAVLVIDDEADQAGLDVSSGGELEGVHQQLRRLVDLQTSDGHRRVAYVAYTATPYANILTSQHEFGLYPRDFIYPLPKPVGYIGSAEIFGECKVGDPIHTVDESDDDADVITPDLAEAIRWFVLATAARVVLGKPLEDFHSSMLIHTTQRTDEQLSYRGAIEAFLGELSESFRNDESSMRDQYLTELTKVPTGPEGTPDVVHEEVAKWEDVRRHVPRVLERLITRAESGDPFDEDGHRQQAKSGVIVDNSKVDWLDRLTYSNVDLGEPSVTVIVTGGNTLSRGLTLEGLVCSYFARTSRTYDSLMQMGRWYGFRRGYRHLVRVWTTGELLSWFRELDKVEQALRAELEWMSEKNMSPSVYGPRIRVLPDLNITRAAAMKSVSKEITYSDTVVDLGWLAVDDSSIDANQKATRALAADLPQEQRVPGELLLFEHVPIEVIRRFLGAFVLHPSERRLDKPSLESYLDAEIDLLAEWNVMFKTLSRSSAEPFDHGGVVGSVLPVSRAMYSSSEPAEIGSLVDSGDHRADLAGARPAGDASKRAQGEPPLLIVYAVDPVSSPKDKDSDRAPLDLPPGRHPISFALAIPRRDDHVTHVQPHIVTVETGPIDMGDYDDE